MEKVWRVYGEFADGSGKCIIGKNKQRCIRRLVSLENQHGKLEYCLSKEVYKNLFLIGKYALTIITVFMMVFIAWGIISYAEILMKNTTENPVYHGWNMFIYFMNLAGENIKTI